MKKVLSIVLAAGFVAIVACGPSAEEKATAEKAVQDSIAAAEQAAAATQATMQDSAAMVSTDSSAMMKSDSTKK